MVGIILFCAVAIVVFVCMITLQDHLSKKEDAVLGLILPIITFIGSFKITYSIAIEPAIKAEIKDVSYGYFVLIVFFIIFYSCDCLYKYLYCKQSKNT